MDREKKKKNATAVRINYLPNRSICSFGTPYFEIIIYYLSTVHSKGNTTRFSLLKTVKTLNVQLNNSNYANCVQTRITAINIRLLENFAVYIDIVITMIIRLYAPFPPPPSLINYGSRAV